MNGASGKQMTIHWIELGNEAIKIAFDYGILIGVLLGLALAYVIYKAPGVYQHSSAWWKEYRELKGSEPGERTAALHAIDDPENPESGTGTQISGSGSGSGYSGGHGFGGNN